MSADRSVYRRHVDPKGLVAFEVSIATTDLQILARANLSAQAIEAIQDVRSDLEAYIASHPRFAESFAPVPVEPEVPPVIREMAWAAEVAGVGPMAAVAGAVAESVARSLAQASPEVIVENGGDLYLMGTTDRVVELWTGGGASGIGLRIHGSSLPLGVATSSATIGPSVSLGRADAVTVLARSGALADAAASAVGNRLQSAQDIERVLEFSRSIEGVVGAVVSIDGAIGAWGDVRLVPLAI